MERDALYFGLVALGALVLWAIFRGPVRTGGRIALAASLIAVAAAYAILFQMIGEGG